MRGIFLGLHLANLLMLATVFAAGVLAKVAGVDAAPWLPVHMALAIFASLLAALAHVATFTYFMATTNWLTAATAKADLDTGRFVVSARAQKQRVLVWALAAVAATMLAMFVWPGGGPDAGARWTGPAHLVLAYLALAVNLVAAMAQYGHLRARGRMMDQVLTILNE